MIKILNQHILFRYIVAGGTSAVADLGLLYFLYHKVGMHYLWSAVIAFSIAFFISFGLQKFWTFKDHSTCDMHKQLFKYLFPSLFGLALNTFLMYVFVDHFKFFVMISQVLAGAMVASCTFFISRSFVFKYQKEHI
jgi:putative flippase GtrA